MIIGGIYIPPQNSSYYENYTFDDVSSDIMNFGHDNQKILLMGDFNARTSILKDYNKAKDDQYTQTQHLASEIQVSRKNFDGQTNSHGHALLDICKTHNLRILNGRKFGDSHGNFTFFNQRNGCSVVGYAIISDSFHDNANAFVVMPQTILSDHCQIVTWISTALKRTGNKSSYPWIPLPKKFKWKSNSKPLFINALASNECKKKIETFIISSDFENSQNDIERANEMFCGILLHAAKMSLQKCPKRKKNPLESKTVV